MNNTQYSNKKSPSSSASDPKTSASKFVSPLPKSPFESSLDSKVAPAFKSVQVSPPEATKASSQEIIELLDSDIESPQEIVDLVDKDTESHSPPSQEIVELLDSDVESPSATKRARDRNHNGKKTKKAKMNLLHSHFDKKPAAKKTPSLSSSSAAFSTLSSVSRKSQSDFSWASSSASTNKGPGAPSASSSSSAAFSTSSSTSTKRQSASSSASSSSASARKASGKHVLKCRSKPLVSEPLTLGCRNDRVLKMVTEASQKAMNVLIQGNAVRCPNNPFTRNQIVPLQFLESVPQIYCRYNEDMTKMVKFGYSGNINGRYTEEELARCKIVVTPRTITDEAEKQLVEIVNELLKALADLKHTYTGPYPIYDFCRLCEIIIHRGGNQLGLDKQVYYQLIEIGCQILFQADVVAEVFSTGEVEQKQRRQEVLNAMRELKPILLPFVGKKFTMMDTWETGRAENRLSSQVCANDKVAGGLPWEDAMPNPVYKNGRNAEEIFSTDWSKEEIEAGVERINHKIREAIAVEGILFLAKNEEKLFPNNGLLDCLVDKYKFEPKFAINGEQKRLVFLVHLLKKSLVVLYSPLGYAMDTRMVTKHKLDLKRSRWLEMEVLCQSRLILTNEKSRFGLVPVEDDCLTAAYCFEAVHRFYHNPGLKAAAVARDVLTPDNVFACKENGLVKRTAENANLIGKRARRVSTLDETGRPVDSNVVVEAANLLSFATAETLPDHLRRVKELLKKPNRNGEAISTQTFTWRLDTLLDKHLVKDSELQKACKKYIRETKQNKGNRNAGKPTDIKANDKIVNKYWEGKEFLILKHSPEKGSFEEGFDPKEYVDKPKWKIFQKYEYVHPRNFVYEGFRKRLEKKKLRNNTNQEKADTARGKKTIEVVNKVYCFPESDEVIVAGPRHSDKAHPGAVVFILARLKDKDEKKSGKQKSVASFFAKK